MFLHVRMCARVVSVCIFQCKWLCMYMCIHMRLLRKYIIYHKAEKFHEEKFPLFLRMAEIREI